jgi:four helix bundle protein
MGNPDDLRAYHAARELQSLIIEMVRRFKRVPPEFKSQLLRAARSVPSSIAKGFGRGTPREELQGLRVARGSLDEVRDDLRTSIRQGYTTEKPFYRAWNLAKVTRRMITKLMRDGDPASD